MDPMTLLMAYAIGVLIGFYIFYLIIKWAVKDGMIEASRQIELSKNQTGTVRTIEKPANTEQEKLQRRYDKGEITFDEYQKEWAKLG